MKMYSKRILTSALALGMCIGMTSCGEDKIADETTAETTAVTTTAPETTAETTVETTAPETEEEKIGLNADLISEYGQTFAEISAKHGKIIEYQILKGGANYRFETGYGWYFFYGTDYTYPSAWGTIEETGRKIPLPDDDFRCIDIDGILASDFFDGDFEYLTYDEIAAIDGITVTYDDVSGGLYGDEGYEFHFKYDGFSHEKLGFTDDRVNIGLYTTVRGRVDQDTKIDIFLSLRVAEKYLNTTSEG